MPQETQPSTCLDSLYRDKKAAGDTVTQEVKNATAKGRWYKAKHREGMCVCFHKKYYKVCIARAVVHENVRTPHNWACVVY